MILVDTGPLVAAANRTDAHHAASVAALAAAKPPRLVPGLVIAEVSYLLARDAGSAVEAEFLRSFTTGFLTVVDLTATDLGRCAALVEQYSDLPLGATDACLVAVAERLEITELATLDRRHFTIVRPTAREGKQVKFGADNSRHKAGARGHPVQIQVACTGCPGNSKSYVKSSQPHAPT